MCVNQPKKQSDTHGIQMDRVTYPHLVHLGLTCTRGEPQGSHASIRHKILCSHATSFCALLYSCSNCRLFFDLQLDAEAMDTTDTCYRCLYIPITEASGQDGFCTSSEAGHSCSRLSFSNAFQGHGLPRPSTVFAMDRQPAQTVEHRCGLGKNPAAGKPRREKERCGQEEKRTDE